MADSVVIADESLPTLEEIPNMKVTDLRKKLKAFGLPITGNKNDLAARLTEFYLSNKGMDTSESSQLSLYASQISELEEAADGTTTIEDSATIEQEHFSYLEPSLEDESKLLTTENKLNSSSNSTVIVTKPLKKRTIISSAAESNPPKKVVLNRTTTAHTEITMNPTSAAKKEITIQNNKVESEKKPTAIKNLSAAERMAIRAKRFNTSNTTVTSTTIKAKNSKDSKQSIISAPVNTDVEVLKKRAERFGQNVSTVLKQIEQKEKLLKRKCKFGASLAAVSSSIDEQERKKLRAARFGVA